MCGAQRYGCFWLEVRNYTICGGSSKRNYIAIELRFSIVGSYHRGEFIEPKYTLWALQNVLVPSRSKAARYMPRVAPFVAFLCCKFIASFADFPLVDRGHERIQVRPAINTHCPFHEEEAKVPPLSMICGQNPGLGARLPSQWITEILSI